MSDDTFGFAQPPFKPAEALVLLKRALRDGRALTERQDTFELKGIRVIEFTLEDQAIAAKLAKRPARGGSGEWDRYTLAQATDVRKFTDEVKKRLARWTEDER